MPELTGKACAPSPHGWIDWEMTEEEIKKKDARINDCISCCHVNTFFKSRKPSIFFKLHNEPITSCLSMTSVSNRNNTSTS